MVFVVNKVGHRLRNTILTESEKVLVTRFSLFSKSIIASARQDNARVAADFEPEEQTRGITLFVSVSEKN